MKNTLKVFWCDIENFGDAFNRDLFAHYGFDPVWSEPDEAEVLGVGSILSHVNQAKFDGIILGSGYRESRHRFHSINANFIAVRGRLTRARTLASRRTLMGDFGLLLPRVFPIALNPEYALGVIPHCMDLSNSWLGQFANSRNVLVINPNQPPESVVRQLIQCANIASSSLHGLISADAFGIPNCWLRLSDNEVGHGFKFFDYYSSFGETRLPLIPWDGLGVSRIVDSCTQPSPTVRDRATELHRVMLDFDTKVNNHRLLKNNKASRWAKTVSRRCRRKYRHLFAKEESQGCDFLKPNEFANW